jgi:hypothetical protein
MNLHMQFEEFITSHFASICVLHSIWQQGTSTHIQPRWNGLGLHIGFLRFLKHLRFPGAFGDGRGGQIPGHFQPGLGQLHLPLSLLPKGKKGLESNRRQGFLEFLTWSGLTLSSLPTFAR